MPTGRHVTTMPTLVATMAMAMALGSCGSASREGGQLVRSDKQRVATPQIPTDDLHELVAGNSDFAFDLYEQLRGEAGNIFYSPHSISAALAMVYAGARGSTEAQMSRALHFDLPQERLHPSINQLDTLLNRRGRGAEAADGGAFRLRVVNALWGQRGYDLLPAYLDTLALHYGTGLRVLDFATEPEPARQVINGWVERETDGRIKNLLAEDKITPSTRLVLTNAIYFNAAWKVPFDPQFTRPGPFTRLDGSSKSASMMSGSQPATYARLNNLQAAVLPYAGDELSLLILLPDAGEFDAVEQTLGRELLGEVDAQQRGVALNIHLPKFGVEQDLDLVPALRALGVVDLFDAADLSGIDGTGRLIVSDVLHKAFVDVSETGTEAAAATAVLMGESGARVHEPEPVTLTVDRPFLFLIRDRATGAVIFVGRVLDPH